MVGNHCTQSGLLGGYRGGQVAFREPAEAERSAKWSVVISWNYAKNMKSSLGIDPRRAQPAESVNYIDGRSGRSRSGQLEVSWFRGAQLA
jgi:hypothetical protein